MTSTDRPESLEGGCLCGAIRFKVRISAKTKWPLASFESGGSCQCTMCRKFTGALLPQCLDFPKEDVEPAFESHATYKTYKSSSWANRGFCSTCGSSLTFNDEREPGIVEIHPGILDEDVLCGKKDEANSWTDAHGEHVPRIGGYGKAICDPQRHLWLENAVPGVSDNLKGKQYLRNSGAGEPFSGKLSDLKKP